MLDVTYGGDEHAQPGEIRVQQDGAASQRHQHVRYENHRVLGRNADQGTVVYAHVATIVC